MKLYSWFCLPGRRLPLSPLWAAWGQRLPTCPRCSGCWRSSETRAQKPPASQPSAPATSCLAPNSRRWTCSCSAASSRLVTLWPAVVEKTSVTDNTKLQIVPLALREVTQKCQETKFNRYLTRQLLNFLLLLLQQQIGRFDRVLQWRLLDLVVVPQFTFPANTRTWEWVPLYGYATCTNLFLSMSFFMRSCKSLFFTRSCKSLCWKQGETSTQNWTRTEASKTRFYSDWSKS